MQNIIKSIDFNQHAMIFEHLPLAMAILSVENYQIEYINEKFACLAGFNKEELLGQDLKGLFNFTDHAVEALAEQIIEQGECRHYEASLTDKNKNHHFGYLSGSLMQLDNARHILIFFDDMKDKLFDKTLNSPKTRFMDMLNNLPCIAWHKDLQGRYLAVNKPFMDFCGKNMEEIINRTDSSVWDAATAERLCQFDQNTILLKSICKIVYPFDTPEGMLCMEVINSPVSGDDGNICGVTGIAFALKDNKQLEEALIKSHSELAFVKHLFEKSQKAGNVGSWHINMQSGEIWFSMECRRIFNIPAGRPVAMEEILKPVVQGDRAKLKTIMFAEKPEANGECNIRIRKNGKIRWLCLKAAAEQEQNGQKYHVTGTVQDITARIQMEETLKNSSLKLEFTEDILNRSQELGKTGSFYYNIKTRYIWWSHGVYSIFELSDDIRINKQIIDDFSVPEDRFLLEHLWECMDKGLPYTFVHRISVNGCVKWIHVITSVQYAANGKPEASIGTVMDITQKKKEEEEINKSKEKLLFMEDTLLRSQQAGNVGSWLMDIKNNMIWGSEEAYRIVGAGKQLLPPASEMIDFVFEKDREKVISAWEKGIKSEYLNAEFRIKKFGEIFWVQCKAIIEKDNAGHAVKAIGIISDITELKKAERELKKSEEKFRTVADWTYTWEYWQSPDKSLVYISPSCERISGYSSEEFLANPALLKSIIHPDDIEAAEKLCGSIDFAGKGDARKSDVVNMEFRIIAKDNTIRWIEHICRGVFSDEGDYLGIRVSNRDITQVKAAEELNRELIKAKEIDKLRTEFFANISHELRMPLTIIFSSLQLIQPVMEHDDMIIGEIESLKKHYRYIRQNCYRLLKLVNNLIDITKIESGYMQPMLQQCDIVEVVRQIAMSVELYVREKGLNLIFQSDTKELIVNSDPDKIERILLNLLSNAAKYNSPGGSITVRFILKQGKYLIEVEDTGEGIEKTKQQDIFERFRQADNSFTRKHEGSGLGLSIVKMILDMLGGSIRVHSDAGSGSVFIVELPLDTKKNQYTLSQSQGLKWYPKVFSVNVEFSDIYS